jgi:uncharacterized protein YqeY
MEELSSGLNEIIRTNGFTAADFGKAMGIASKAYAGQADGKVISDLLRSILK